LKKLTICIVYGFLTHFGFCQNWVSVGGGADLFVRNIFSDTLTNRLYAVGEFHEIGGTPAYRVAYWDGINWVSMCDTSFVAESNPIMWGTIYNNEIFVSGTHSVMGDSVTGKISHYLGNSNWESFGNPAGYCAIETIDDKLFAIGNFDSIGNKPLKNMAVWDGISWEPIGDSTTSNSFNVSFIGEIEKYNSNYVLGGNIDSPPFKEIMQWDGTNWTALGNGIPGDAWVNCIKSYKGILYIGGYFNEPGFPNFLVAWDGQNFFKPFPDVNFLDQVWDLEVINEELYILGMIELSVPTVTYGLTKFDGDSLCVFGGSSIYNTPGARQILELNDELYVTANKLMLDDTVNYIARWNGTEMDTCIFSPVHLAINELNEDDTKYSVYPNPVSDFLFVDYIGNEKLISLTILNVNDQILYQATSITNSNKIDVSNFQNGCYLIRIEDDTSFVSIKKWIKE
jgi:hypothetical protein